MIQPTHIVAKNNLPFFWYLLPVVILLILGLSDTLYLAYSHYKNYTDVNFSSFCALSKAINCDTVSQSPWSIFLGLPLAFWGFFAYILFLTLCLATLKNRENSIALWHILFLLGAIYSLAAIALGYIATTKIKAYCILCLASYAVSFSLLFFSWIIIRRFSAESFIAGLARGARHLCSSSALKGCLLSLFALFLGVQCFLPPYWQWQYDSPALAANIPHGLTEEGLPWIGSESPAITIHEFTDYQCFQCSKIHQFLRRLIAEHPGKLKLIHHHYPMDHEFNTIIVPEPFHIGSGKMAMIGIYAASKNKFWEMNDALYALGRQKEPFNTKALAKMTGFSSGELAAATQHPEIRESLLHDIRQGMKFEIVGTPTFVIDGKVHSGTLPAEILKQILQ